MYTLRIKLNWEACSQLFKNYEVQSCETDPGQMKLMLQHFPNVLF